MTQNTKLRYLVERLGVADVVDALSASFTHKSHILDLASPDPTRMLFGPALTISFLPTRLDLMDMERHSLGPAFYDAIDGADPAGHVLVMASGGHPDVSLGGGTKLSRLPNHGLDGVLCDGRLRDFEELQEYDVGVYCKGETVRAGGPVVRPYLTQVPVAVAGVTIVPGDFIFAQGSSAAVIPASIVEPTLERALKIMAKMDHLKAGMRTETVEDVRRGAAREI